MVGFINELLDIFVKFLLENSIVTLIEQIFSTLNQIINSNGIFISPEVETIVFSHIEKMSELVFMPIGFTVLVIFLLIDFLQIVTRYESSTGLKAVQTPAVAVIKTALIIKVFNEFPNLMIATKSLCDYIITKLSQFTIASIDITSMSESVRILAMNESASTIVWSVIFSFVALVVTWFAFIIVWAVCVGRIFEIFIYMCVAPLPLATLPGSQSSVAINFIKSFIAVCLQGVIVFLILFIAKILFAAFLTTSSLFLAITSICVYCIVLIIAISGSGKLARSIMNVI